MSNKIPDSLKAKLTGQVNQAEEIPMEMTAAEIKMASLSQKVAAEPTQQVQEAVAKQQAADNAPVTQQPFTPPVEQTNAFASPLSINPESLAMPEGFHPDDNLGGKGFINRVDPKTLDNMQIDLNSIVITKKTPLLQTDDFNFVFNRKNKATYEVPMHQSGYTAHMSALPMLDVMAINGTFADPYSRFEKLYRVVHQHIESSSIGNIGFQEWAQITAYQDLENALYGIYCQTFPGQNEFDIKCKNCGKNTKFTISNTTLVTIRDEEVYKLLDELRFNAKTAQELVGKSLVHSVERILLPESKIIFDVQTPSLWDHLQMLKTLHPSVIQQFGEAIGTVLFIKQMLMLDVEATVKTGKPNYYVVDSREKILDSIIKLSVTDGTSLNSSIDERFSKYNVTYSIKNATCGHCRDPLGDIPLSMERVLFHQIETVLATTKDQSEE